MKSFFSRLRRRLLPSTSFSSERYWSQRYREGGTSGPGSYGDLARFKAEILNAFVARHGAASVIEFGCGDGNQLGLAEYPRYTGYDVSHVALSACRRRFAADATKEFFLIQEYDGRKADLALSLDVIFHLTEDSVFDAYMRRLFGASQRHVIVYSSNQEHPDEDEARHVRHRNFTRWVEQELAAEWNLVQTIPNRFPYDGNSRSTSFSDFFVYAKR